MTNREYMGHLLLDADFIDDGGAAYANMVMEYINCPYWTGDERGECYSDESSVPHPSYDDRCFHCKLKWLNAENDE